MNPQPPQANYPEVQWQGHSMHSGAVYSQQVTPVEEPLTTSYTPSALLEASHQAMGGMLQSNGSVRETPVHTPQVSRLTSADDEVPFTFGADYVAATAALFNSEVLPAYPNFAAMGEPIRSTKYPEPPPRPRHSFYINSDHDSLPPSPSSPSYIMGELYGTVAQQDDVFHPSLILDYPMDSPLSYATSYSPGSSSSLTGWAG
jgi:hypothetical protein